MLVGRDRELEAIDAALHGAVEGQGQLLLLVGEPGIGKTRLAEEASTRARARGLRVAWGRSWEGTGAPSGWPWTQIARELLADGVPLAPPEALELGAILPELRRPELALDPTGFRTFDVLLQLLKRAARQTPRLIVLDDLHAADSTTLSGLHFVARALRELPVVVVGTHREAEARLRDEPRAVLERIAREGTRFVLDRLNEADVAALLCQRIGQAGAAAAQAVHRCTEGNPLFVHEVAHLIERGHELPGPRASLPEGIRAAVADHLALLGEPTRRLLGIAALLGRAFSAAELAAVAGVDADAVHAALSEASAAGIVTPPTGSPLGSSVDGASFGHILLAEALAAQLPPSERARLHEGAARWLMARPGEDLTRTAHHLLEANGEPAEIIGWARRAATHALQSLAFDQAADLYGRAAAHVSRLESGERVGIELAIGRGEALARAGAIEEAIAVCTQAARSARAAEAADLEARAALACASYFSYLVPIPEVVALLERAVQSVGASNPGLRARLLAQLSCTLYPSPVPGRTVDLAREAVTLARGTADPEVLLPVLHETAISGLPHSMRARERLAFGRELMERAMARGEAYALIRGQLMEVLSQLELGEAQGAEERIQSVHRSVCASGARRERGLLCLVRALHARLQGRFAEADACIEESLAWGLPRDQEYNLAIHTWAQAYTRGNREDLIAARALKELRMPPLGTTWVAAALGEVEEARRQLEAFRPTGDFAWPAMVAGIADACVHVGDAALAGVLYPLLAPAAGEVLLFGPVVCAGPADRILGGLAALRGEGAAALRHFEAAIVLSERLGAAPFLARSLFACGRLLLGESPGAAREMLDRARRVAAPLGMHTLVEQIAALDHGMAPAPVGPVQAQVTLVRDGETWVLSGSGDSVRLRDSKGVGYLGVLLREPHRELHVAELYGMGAGAVERGDAGPLIDAVARRQYERRIEVLEDELREAEAFDDRGRAGRAEEELDRLAEELARAVGLGGRERRAGSLTERARINVQRRLKDVLTRVARQAPALGRHLDAAVKTGVYCSYCPLDPSAPG